MMVNLFINQVHSIDIGNTKAQVTKKEKCGITGTF